MHGFWTVWCQDAAILPHTSGDGQTGLVPHGFRKRQLMWTDEGGNRETVERRSSFDIFILHVQEMHAACTKHDHTQAHTYTWSTHTKTIREGAFTLTAVIMCISKTHWYKIFFHLYKLGEMIN